MAAGITRYRVRNGPPYMRKGEISAVDLTLFILRHILPDQAFRRHSRQALPQTCEHP